MAKWLEVIFFNTRARGATRNKRLSFRSERIRRDSACLEEEENVSLKFWVKQGCSLRCTQIVPKWPLHGQVAGSDFYDYACAAHHAQNITFFRREQIWVGSGCLEMEDNAFLKFWFKLECSP